MKIIAYSCITFFCLSSPNINALFFRHCIKNSSLTAALAPKIARRYTSIEKKLFEVHEQETQKAWQQKLFHQQPFMRDRYEDFLYNENYGKPKAAFKALMTSKLIEFPRHHIKKWSDYTRLLWVYYRNKETMHRAFYFMIKQNMNQKNTQLMLQKKQRIVSEIIKYIEKK